MPNQNPESFSDLLFPGSGIDVSRGFSQQRPNTTPSGINCRTFEPSTNRARGGQRPGLSKYIPLQPDGQQIIQNLSTLIGVGYSPPGGSMQTSSSGRVVTLVAVSGGNVYAASPGGSTWTQALVAATLSSPPLTTSGIVMSAANNQKLWLADGVHYVYYDPSINTVQPWVATQGTLPLDTGGNPPRLVVTWRGRTVLSGLQLDPQNWFMSAVSDPTNWDYAPFNITPTQAVAGNNSSLGLIGDVVTTMIPYTDDVLIFGGDHTIWQMSGDPMAGGQIDLISDAIGMAWGIPWCKAPDGTIYFVSNRTGIYALQPGQGAPFRISQPIEQLLIPINTGSNTIRLIWNDRFQGLHVFISPTGSQSSATHFFWEQRAGDQRYPGAWWMDTFANNALNPLTCCTLDGNLPGDRTPIIGSWDGYARAIDPTATTDDGTQINSSVTIGPLLTPNLDDVLMKDIQAVLGATSGPVSYAIYVGPTAEIALSSQPVTSGIWTAGRNLTNHVRRSGHALYVVLTASSPWALEGIRARIAGSGKVRRRGV